MRKKFEPPLQKGVQNNLQSKFEPGTETTIIVNCKIVQETPKAWLIKSPIAVLTWLPKSLTILHTHSNNKALHDVELPTWIAKDKGLDE